MLVEIIKNRFVSILSYPNLFFTRQILFILIVYEVVAVAVDIQHGLAVGSTMSRRRSSLSCLASHKWALLHILCSLCFIQLNYFGERKNFCQFVKVTSKEFLSYVRLEAKEAVKMDWFTETIIPLSSTSPTFPLWAPKSKDLK